MKKFLGGVAIAAMAATSAASASDLPAKAPMAAPLYNWSGFHAGFNAGGALDPAHFQTSTVFDLNGYFALTSVPAVNAAGDRKVHTPGFVGGIQAGYDWQTSNTVLGIEADFNYMGIKGSAVSSAAYPEFAPDTFTIRQSLKANWLLTVRPRIGLAANNWLFYVTGGLAVAKIKADFTFFDTIGATENASISQTKAGWALGGGIEYGIAGPWSLKVEYLHLDFGDLSTTSISLSQGGDNFPINPFTHSVKFSDGIVRAGLNYRFHP